MALTIKRGVSPVNETVYEHHSVIGDVEIPRGKVVYQLPTGRVAPARANAVATSKVLGIVAFDDSSGVGKIQPGRAGSVVTRGTVEGFDLSAHDAGTVLYLDPDSDGGITATKPTDPGDVVVPLGIVKCMTDMGRKKVLFFCPDLLAELVAIAP